MTRQEEALRTKLKSMDAKLKFSYTTDNEFRRVTNAVIFHIDRYFMGFATCSKEDGFNRKIGRSIALGRAYRMLGSNLSTSIREVPLHLRFDSKEIVSDAS